MQLGCGGLIPYNDNLPIELFQKRKYSYQGRVYGSKEQVCSLPAKQAGQPAEEVVMW